MSGRPGEWRLELPATLAAVEQFCVDFRLWRSRACAMLDSFSAELLLREALTNSVLHGCAGEPGQLISCLLRVKPGRLVIAIQDAGQGFDWRSKWNRRSDVLDTSGRGIEIIRQYANLVRFNPKGNSLTMVKRFREKGPA